MIEQNNGTEHEVRQRLTKPAELSPEADGLILQGRLWAALGSGLGLASVTFALFAQSRHGRAEGRSGACGRAVLSEQSMNK